MPLHAHGRSHVLHPLSQYLITSAVMPPSDADRVVVTVVRPAAPASPVAATRAPVLKPYQPNQRMKVPSATSGAECPGIGIVRPSASKRPSRGPTATAPSSAAKPPTMWTTALPATSIIPTPSRGAGLYAESQPWGDQIQWATTGYTRPVMRTL